MYNVILIDNQVYVQSISCVLSKLVFKDVLLNFTLELSRIEVSYMNIEDASSRTTERSVSRNSGKGCVRISVYENSRMHYTN